MQTVQSSEFNLTPREIEVLKSIATKGCYKDACRELSISKQTLQNHLRNIKDKVHADSIPQLVHIMTKRGII